MKELGRILKTTRESKGLTLDEIQERTKIRKRYLQAIEDGDLAILPGLVYARGFIKNYAEQLGLDGQALMQEHGLMEEPSTPTTASRSQPRAEDNVKKEGRQPKHSSPSGDKGNRILPQVLMTVAVIGLLGVGLWYLTNRQTASDKPPKQEGQQSAAPATQPPAPQPPAPVQPKPAEPLKPETKDKVKSIYKVDGDKIKLEIDVANNDCWLEITTDSQTQLSKVAAKGTKLSFEADKQLVMSTGYSPALIVKVNDLPVELEQVNGRYDFDFRKK